MRTNRPAKSTPIFTHEGAPAVLHLTPEQQLRRSVASCLLFEGEFYESGKSIADRIRENAEKVAPEYLADLAKVARSKYNLRHVPLLLLETLTRTGKGSSIVSQAIADTIQRADEIAEFLAIYTHGKQRKSCEKGHGRSISAQTRKGLAMAFAKFNEYSLAKYDRDGVVKLRDALRLARPKPADDDRSALYKGLVNRTLAAPDTWEVALSGGADKKATFERLLREHKLGYFALLRNLRGMADAGCDPAAIREAIEARKGGAERVLPFRFVAAARACPQFEPSLDKALCATIAEMTPLPGRTLVLVDVSGSMDAKLSGKSDMRRIDAAAALASIINGDVRMFSFSDAVKEVPPRRGLAGVDALVNSQIHGGTRLGDAVHAMNLITTRTMVMDGLKNGADRLIVITDEQSHDRVPDPEAEHAYMINTASYKNGVGYGKWVHIDGFSESIIRFIHEVEAEEESE
jgi:60 kDa SS-A/Ro ribonucleoprotein